jgi:hypothetical protein
MGYEESLVHGCRGKTGVVTNPHDPVESQASHWPVQARLQQIPSGAQKPD